MDKDKKITAVLSAFYIATFLFIFSFGALLFTCQPFFCKTCHEMDADVEAWENSAHSKVNCLSCHVEPGWSYLIKDKLMAVKSMFYHFFPLYEKPINGKSLLSEEMHDENCLRCHSLVKVTPSEGILIDHEAHEENEVHCSFCHNRIGHPEMAGYIDRMGMETCMEECHNDEKAPRECSHCHTEDFKLIPEDHDEKEKWRDEHGKIARKEKEECLMCHFEEKQCNDCHKMAMPHPVNWERDHKDDPKLFAYCINCHTDKYFCERCHHPGYEPTVERWRAVHPKVVKEKGEKSCQDCHEIKFCNNCHRK